MKPPLVLLKAAFPCTRSLTTFRVAIEALLVSFVFVLGFVPCQYPSVLERLSTLCANMGCLLMKISRVGVALYIGVEASVALFALKLRRHLIVMKCLNYLENQQSCEALWKD